MRVLHLGKYYPPHRGGIETHLHALGHGLSAEGVQTTALVVNHAGAGGDVVWRPTARTRSVSERDGPVRVERVGRVANVARLDVCPRLPLRLRRLAREADLLHLHVPNPTMGFALASLVDPPPFVITHHSDVLRQRVLRHALRPLDEVLYRRAARVLATSPRYVEGSALLQRFRAKTEVLPFGIDLTPFQVQSPRLAREAELLEARFRSPRWLMVGRLVYYKGHALALEAFRELPGTLLIVGQGPAEEELRRRAEELGVSARVSFLGSVRDEVLRAAYRVATALLFPGTARSEAFGLAQVEAMASGCPVINTEIPGSGVPWVCPHEEAGLTVPLGDARALAGAARRLVQEPGLAARLGQGGRARAAERFSQAVMARACAELYARVLAEAGA